MKVHLKVSGVDCRKVGQTEFEYNHQAACGFVRDNVTTNKDHVDCFFCLNTENMKGYKQLKDRECYQFEYAGVVCKGYYKKATGRLYYHGGFIHASVVESVVKLTVS